MAKDSRRRSFSSSVLLILTGFGCSTGIIVKDDPCENVSCHTPPPDGCVSDTTFRTYQATGSCTAGACHYEYAENECTDGCVEDECLGCEPNCSGRCGGAPDGCDGFCTTECDPGFWCDHETCTACGNLPQHCGTECRDCTAQGTNWDCIDGACGCDGPEDCSGTATCEDNSCGDCTPPSISTPPTDDDTCAGSNASFSVQASGTPTLTCQWQVSTNGGSSWDNVTDGGIYGGATGTTLSLTGVTAAMDGYQYRAAATNHCGADESTAGVLTVNVPSTAPTSISASLNPICPNGYTTLTAQGGTLGTDAEYQWFAGSCSGGVLSSASSYAASPSSSTTYYVRRAGGSCNVTTNCASLLITTSTKPDLVVTRIRPEPFSPKVGDGVHFAARVKNVGSGTVPAGGDGFVVTFWLPHPNYVVFTTYTGGLSPGEEVEVPLSGEWTAQPEVNGTPVSSVFAYVDDAQPPPGKVDECNETNNGYGQDFTVRPDCGTTGCPSIFGYYDVTQWKPDLGWNSYVADTAPWSNVVFVNANWDWIPSSADWSNMASHGVKAIVIIGHVFFEWVDTNAPSGNNFDLKAAYQTSWQDFVSSRSLEAHTDQIAAFYLLDEPYWNGATYNDLLLVTEEMKKTFPAIPIALVEASGTLSSMTLPKAVDWVGFDLYGQEDPRTGLYQTFLSTLRTKTAASARQRIIYVTDAFWKTDHISGQNADYMATVASYYDEMAVGDATTIAEWPFVWDNYDTGIYGSGDPVMQTARNTQATIGRRITGKP